jgi:hypothetical protein
MVFLASHGYQAEVKVAVREASLSAGMCRALGYGRLAVTFRLADMSGGFSATMR